MKCRECKCVKTSEAYFSHSEDDRGPLVTLWHCKLMFSGSDWVEPGEECHFEQKLDWIKKKKVALTMVKAHRDSINKGHDTLKDSKLYEKWVKEHLGWI